MENINDNAALNNDVEKYRNLAALSYVLMPLAAIMLILDKDSNYLCAPSCQSGDMPAAVVHGELCCDDNTLFGLDSRRGRHGSRSGIYDNGHSAYLQAGVL